MKKSTRDKANKGLYHITFLEIPVLTFLIFGFLQSLNFEIDSFQDGSMSRKPSHLGYGKKS